MNNISTLKDVDLSLFCEQSVNPIIITVGAFEGENNPQILYVNKALCDLSGYSFDEIIGKTPRMFQGPKSNKTLLEELKKNLSIGKPFEGFTINYRKDGSEYFIHWNISPIKNENGDITYYFAVQKDMTDSFEHVEYLENKLKTMEDEKRLQEKLVKDSQKAAVMGEMLDIIAHQWAQPITIMKGWSEMVKDDNIQEKFTKQLDHLHETLTEFRTFFRPDKTSEIFSINDTITSSLILLKDTLASMGVVVDKNLSNDLELIGFPNEFKHIIINLIKNSIDAFQLNNSSKRHIMIETVSDDDFTYIVYRDTAGGIPNEIIPKIFEKNYTTKENAGGTGIGLFFSKQIIEKINGTITVENIGDGVCFIVKFPK